MTGRNTRPKPGQDPSSLFSVPRLYDAAFSWDTGIESRFYGRRLRVPRKRFDESRRMVEFACGTGRMLKPLVQLGFSCVGIDFNRTMVAYANRKKFARNAGLVVADIRELPIRPGTFSGAVCAIGSLNYLGSMKAVEAHLSDAARILRKGGKYIIDFPMGVPSKKTDEWETYRARTRYRTAWRITRVDSKNGVMYESIKVRTGPKVLFQHRSTMKVIRKKPFEKAATRAGFVLEECFPSFRSKPEHELPEQGRVIAVLKKAA